MADDRAYRILVQFDAEHERFRALVPELDVNVAGESRSEAIEAAEAAIDAKFEAAATDDGEPLNVPIDLADVDTTVTVELAMPLARELKYHADRSKVSVDRMAEQLLVRAIGLLNVGLKPQPKPRTDKAADAEKKESEVPEQQRGGGRKGRGRGRGQGRRGEGYRPEIEDQANFLAYVRDMEKGGGRRR